jgi:exodeoxyribonuclease V alpha subunit
VFDVIEAEPHRLREVAGIGPKRADGIATGWAEQRAIREIMIFLHANGVGTSRAVRIYKTYGSDAIQVISEDPYRLARDIRGIGFKTADALAMKLGIEKTAMIRARAGISFALTEALDEGHCGLPSDDLLPLAVKLLEIPDTIILDALRLELDAGQVIADQVEGRACVFLGGVYHAERSTPIGCAFSCVDRCPGNRSATAAHAPKFAGPGRPAFQRMFWRLCCCGAPVPAARISIPSPFQVRMSEPLLRRR